MVKDNYADLKCFYMLSRYSMLFRRLFSTIHPEVEKLIKDVISKNDVVLFMKGHPESPLCGFSRNCFNILKTAGVSKITTVNVMVDERLRQGIKDYSNWPTIPQVYIKGEFLGGNDILDQMSDTNELREYLIKRKIEFIDNTKK